MPKRRTGLNPTAYLGVEAPQPPNLVSNDRAPLTTDYFGFNTGDFWIDENVTPRELYWLASKANRVATWLKFASGADVPEQFPTDSGTAVAINNILNVFGDHGINTAATAAPANNTINIAIDNTITLGDLADVSLAAALTIDTGNIVLSGSTAAAATNPIINFSPNNRISFFLNDVYLGQNAGNLTATHTGVFNVGIGSGAPLGSLTSGDRNIAIGNATLTNCTTGAQNTCVGYTTGSSITTGSSNLCFGHEAGINITTGSRNILIDSTPAAGVTTGDSDNIMIGTPGTGGDNNTLRIGNGTGAGNNQLNRCFISGIRGITTGVADAIAVFVDSANQLGTASSSIKYKMNIKDLNSQSEIIYKLRPVSFNFKKHPDVPAWGLIAEEVEEIFPQLVVYKDNEPESIKYHEISVLLLNELQKLNKRLEQLEAKECKCTQSLE